MKTNSISPLKNFIFESENNNKLLSIETRIKILKDIKKWIIKNEGLIKQSLCLDLNKSCIETILSEMMVIVRQIDSYVKKLKRFFKPKKVKSEKLIMLFSKSYVAFKPVGTVFLINPFNYPFHLSMLPLITSIACGNYTIMKNSDKTLHVNAIFRKMIEELKLNDVIKYMNEKLSQLDIFTIISYKPGLIFFTGGKNFGSAVKQVADKYNVKVILELGSACPVIIDNTCDVEIAARRIIWGKLFNSGQTCVSPNSIFIEASIYDEVKNKLQEQLDIQCINNKCYKFAKMIDIHHLKNVVDYVQKNTKYKLEYNEQKLSITPKIIEIPDNMSPILKHEIFGPILFLTKFEKNDEFFINHKKGFNNSLSLYLFTKDQSLIDKVEQFYNFGTIVINECLIQANNINLPFGGIRDSGIGKYHGDEGLREFSIMYSILKGSKIDLSIRYLHNICKKVKMFERLLRK